MLKVSKSQARQFMLIRQGLMGEHRFTGKDGAYGYDALNSKYVDMFQAGIVDPAKVTRSALTNAASVASMLLTTEAAVVELPEEKSSAPAMPAGMGGMPGMM